VSKENPDSSSKSKKMKEGELGKEITSHKNKNKNKNKDDNNGDDHDDDQMLWNSIAKNYEMIQGAQIANSFILLMAVSQSTATLKDSLEYRLRHDGYVESTELSL
jgi:hypothetical protein